MIPPDRHYRISFSIGKDKITSIWGWSKQKYLEMKIPKSLLEKWWSLETEEEKKRMAAA
jgi:hypothetical protein